MPWIIEQFFGLIYDLWTGQATNSEKIFLLIPLTIVVGCILSWQQIWNLIKNLKLRAQKFTRLNKFEAEITAKREKIQRVTKEIEGRIYEINEHTSKFEIKRNEALERLKVLATKINEDSDLYSLKGDIEDLSDAHGLSVETIREIKQLLEQVIDVTRADELRRNSRELTNKYLSRARARQSANNSKNR
jgi:vacuolar-type H+-ATPase subunit I/STV1